MTPSCGMLPGDRETKCVCVCCVSSHKKVSSCYIKLHSFQSAIATCCYAHNVLVAIAKARLHAAVIHLLPKP